VEETTTGQPVARQRESAWSPLRHAAFRSLWIATIASNVGTWMHDTAASWLMTSLSRSTLLVALMQTATSLPMLFLALPAGALADVVDRRRLLLVTQAWMLAAAALLGALTLGGVMSPWLLLALTFFLGLGTALNTPAWQATTPDLVPRRELAAAVSLGGVATNIARAIGPAVGGLLVAAVGSGGVFLINAASFVAVLAVIARWESPERGSVLPAERVWGAMRAGGRYVRHSPEVRAVAARTLAFIVFASALWALLPVLARHDMGLAATGYGTLLGSLGVGAIAGVAVLPPVRARYATDRLVALGSLLYAASVAGLALVHVLPLAWVALFATGVAWITVMPAFNVATQRAAPDWVRARMLAVYVLVFQGGMALGSAAWGTVASHVGVRNALLLSAGGMALSVLAGLRWRLAAAEAVDVTPSGHWRDPVVAGGDLAPEDGPVLVTVEYRVSDGDADAFAAAMAGVERVRRRDGAINWGLYRDTAQPGRYVETFVAESWGEHLRQHARATVADEEVEARARAYHRGPAPPAVRHMINLPVPRHGRGDA
jgi:MFS family permease